MTASIAPYADTSLAHEVLEKFLDWVGTFHRFTPGPTSGYRILEVGCGAGHSTVAILERMGLFGEIKAIEPDAGYLEQAKTRVWETGLPGNVQFYNHAVQQITDSLSGLSSDFFIWANGIHYLEKEDDLREFFKNMRHYCLEGGFVCTAFWQGSVDRKAFSVLGKMTRFALEHLGLTHKDEGVPSPHRLHEWSLGDYERFARDSGYGTVDILQVPMQLPVEVYMGIAHDDTWVNNALPAEGALAKFTQEERIQALVVGAQRAYEEAGVETTQRNWAFFRVS